MDEVVQKAIREVASKAKKGVPWEFDKPYDQPYYTWTGSEWEANNANSSANQTASEISKLALYSWNIDFMLPYADSRMSKGIAHLKGLIERDSEESTANIIYLQECVESDLKLLASHPWVRETFALTDLDISYWQSGHYGTVSLIDRRLPISNCFRVHYSQTRMERDGLFVDVNIRGKNIRLCNTHLESLALEPPYRPPQIKLCAEYMRASGIDGAVAAGDFNAIQDFDRTLHSENSLKDAYLELAGKEDDKEGHTWGQQAATALRNQFGTSRMDKVYFRGGLELLSLEKFGSNVCVADAGEGEDIVKLGFDKPWITDHLGIKAVFGIEHDSKPTSSL
ncbi:hypothetical protein M409DRAFT_62956 [Zasmidium cellare ATCC 36951]|uniref:Endonuclease/exonuclease/phosphatase domain-containing protein n=1 Tax=Zasmidium cellare ATCC 36951 TaxID=1080233 RepID=A0A6A6CY97_ZASCE|nr:uncharacterized protein M409DRAFT_62956 [Zasmidium cellare ATCC 36951]KAF2172197.1 hypothetical protein M409DRAFT_62956 [Zasmidium cellare ATCC 36951]